MKVLVTGGAGFIGSAVVDEYISQGFDVIVVDNLTTGKEENINPKAKFYKIDILSEEIEDIFREEKPQIINHHAAQISVPESVKNPLFDAYENILGTIKLLELGKKYRIKKFIFASTGGAIYGDNKKTPTPETETPEPMSPYAISKLSAERYIMYFSKFFPYVILRYSNIYGPRQTPHGEAGVVSIFIQNILDGKIPKIYHYEDEEGMIRDYLYVEDVAKANFLAIRNGENEIINISTGKGTKTYHLYKVIAREMERFGFSIPEPQKAGYREGDLKISILDNTKAKKILGWEPKFTLEEGIKKTIEFFVSKIKGKNNM